MGGGKKEGDHPLAGGAQIQFLEKRRNSLRTYSKWQMNAEKRSAYYTERCPRVKMVSLTGGEEVGLFVIKAGLLKRGKRLLNGARGKGNRL